MKFLFAVMIAVSIAVATYVAAIKRTHAYPVLRDITRVDVRTDLGSWAVCDPKQIADFVDLANQYRDGWRYDVFEQSKTDYHISFATKGQRVPRDGFDMSATLVYRQGDDLKLATHGDPNRIFSAFIPFILRVTSDPTLPYMDIREVVAPAGFWCE